MTSTELRPTRQRRAVSAALEAISEFKSAQEVHDALTAAGEKVGLSTVYRTLQAMAEAGDVDVVRSDTGEAFYRRCATGHHHHLVCRSCGRTVEIEGPGVERWANNIAREHDFRDVSHTLELFGTCSNC